ncbi:MAG TPA: GntR family transcriptional regulator [Candidatus Coproplasma stercoravium]|nr:GntR family transcriptional regulator [Candidatus Coproplasma stercoravium]
MKIILSGSADLPIYERLKNGIKSQIAAGELAPGSMLPSIRVAAKELGIGIITVKRAYDDLCREGYLFAEQGRGVFVSNAGSAELSQKNLAEFADKMRALKEIATALNITPEQAEQIFREIWRKD